MGAKGILLPFWKSNFPSGIQVKKTYTLLLVGSSVSFSLQNTAGLFVKLCCSSKKAGPFQRTEFDAPNSTVRSCFLL